MITITSGPHFTLALSLFLSLSVCFCLFLKRKSINCLFPQRHLNWITRLIITILNHYRATISRVYLGQFNLFFPPYSFSFLVLNEVMLFSFLIFLLILWYFMHDISARSKVIVTHKLHTYNNRSLYITWRLKLWWISVEISETTNKLSRNRNLNCVYRLKCAETVIGIRLILHLISKIVDWSICVLTFPTWKFPVWMKAF